MTRHALLLTAGLGTRLQPLTRVRAKPAIPVAGEPMARRIIRWLGFPRIHELVLNLHHPPHPLPPLAAPRGWARAGPRARAALPRGGRAFRAGRGPLPGAPRFRAPFVLGRGRAPRPPPPPSPPWRGPTPPRVRASRWRSCPTASSAATE